MWADLWSVPPSSYLLRGLVPSRRIHSLPLDKRYPESPEQHAEVLRRHRTMLDALRNGADSAYLLTYGMDDDQSGVEPGSMLVAEWVEDEDEPDSASRAYGLSVTVGSLPFDTLVSQSAADELRFALVADDASWMFAPYDGGIDLFCLDERRLDAVWGSRPDWHPGDCECAAHSSERIRWDEARGANARTDMATPHDCDEMSRACADARVPIEYDEVVREWLVRTSGHPYSVALDHCPWCGEELPESLNGPYERKACEVFGYDISRWPDPLRASMPLEYQTGAWWQGRFADDDDGWREMADETAEAVLADDLPRMFST